MPLYTVFDAVLVPILIFVGLKMRRRNRSDVFKIKEIIRGAGLADGNSGRSALMTSLAATVGTANIAGAAEAVIKGGPGALVWMWLCGILGMGIKYCEAVLSVKFAVKNDKGEAYGGPMYCMEKTMGRSGRKLGKLYSTAGLLGALTMGALWQTAAAAGMLSETALSAFEGFDDTLSLRTLFGAAAAALALTVLLGGGKRTMHIAEKLVPIMCIGYAVAALTVILSGSARLLPAMKNIMTGIFDPAAVTGGVLAGGRSAIFSTAAVGLQTGTFSGEAGLGSAGISYASGAERNPVKAGFCGMIEVFIDTMLICTLTVLALLCSGTMSYGSGDGTKAVLIAFASAFGYRGAGVFLSISITLFAMSSIFTWSWYGASYLRYITSSQTAQSFYEIIFTLTVFAGTYSSTAKLGGVISISNTLLVLPNSLLLISNKKIIDEEEENYIMRDAVKRKQPVESDRNLRNQRNDV